MKNIEFMSILWEATSDEILKNELQGDLAMLMNSNTNFSREKISNLGQVLTIWFVPTSNAYNTYGQYITVRGLTLNSDAKKEIGANIRKGRNTFGELTCKAVAQVSGGKEITFDTREIWRVDRLLK